MDGIDIKILGQLSRGASSHGFQPEVKGAYGRIAKNLGLDEDTIRKRVDRLESAGVITGWRLVPNAALFGRRMFFLLLTVDPGLKIDDAIRKIRLVRGILGITRGLGDVLGVALLAENEESVRKKVELIRELVSTKELRTLEMNHPRMDMKLSPTDLKIIRELRPNPLVSYSDVAERLGISSRTVRRRMTKLAQANALFFMPQIDPSRLEGASLVDVYVYYASSDFKGEVDRAMATKFQDFLLRAGWGSPNHGHFMFLIPNIRMAQEIVDWARSIKGVRDVDSLFMIEWLNFFDDVSAEVAEDELGFTR